MRNQTIWLLLASLAFANPAHAGRFGDAFRNWLLGSEAQASLSPAVKLDSDVESEQCLSCHNGTKAAHITVKDAESPLQIRGFQTVNHPIGMNYDQYVARKPMEYRPRVSLSPNIGLVDGKVGCVSCHRLRDQSASGPQIFPYDHVRTAVNNGWYSAAAEFDWYAISTGFDWYNDEVDAYGFSTTEGCLASDELAAGPRETDLCLSCHIK